MEKQIIFELESAAALLMAAPNVVSNSQRQSVETVFLNFRKTKSPYTICREILETSQVPYVLFEAAEVLKCALIREWTYLQDGYTTSLRNYLSQYITSRELPVFVQDRILQTIAIMVKRSSVDDFGQERAVILTEVEGLIMNAEHPKKILGCKIIINIMQEYATTVKSTDVGLPWEVHFKAKKQFEATDLMRIFQFSVRVLSEIVNTDQPYSENMISLMKYLLMIVETILTWGYISPLLPKRLIGVYEALNEADLAPSLRLGISWKPIVLEPQLIPLIFQLYWKVRDHDNLAYHALTALVQLASVNGAVLSNIDDKIQYLGVYIENFLKLISSVNVKSKEAMSISNIVRKIQLFHDLVKMSTVLRESYIDEITRLTCCFAEGAAAEETDTEDHNFSFAFDNMLEAWVSLLQEYQPYTSSDFLCTAATRIFNTYLQCHLSPPDGRRRYDPGEDEVEDGEDNDRVKYCDQLQTVGMFGRVVLGYSLPVLYKLLEDRTNKLKCHLHAMQTQAMSINDAAVLDNIFEDIHWITLISGHTLCMDSDGETPLIPSEIMQYSIAQTNKAESSLESTLTVMAGIQQMGVEVECIETCDHAIRIFSDIMKLCVVETSAAEVKLGHFMSPEVGCTLMWFLKRWCRSYLMPVETFYGEISPTLIGALGWDTEGANFVANFVLGKIQSNIVHFSSEPILLQDTVDLFVDVVGVKQKSIYIVKTPALWNLVQLQSKLGPGKLPHNARRALYTGFTLAGYCLAIASNSSQHTPNVTITKNTILPSSTNTQSPSSSSTSSLSFLTSPPSQSSSFLTPPPSYAASVTSNSTVRTDADTYYAQILKPLQFSFKELVCRENFNLIYQQDGVQAQVVDILEAFTGVAKGALISTAELLFEYLAPVLSELPVFLTVYRNYQVIVQLILELFSKSAKYILCFLPPNSARSRFYESTSSLVRAYAKCNVSRFTAEAFAEESNLQDLSLLMDLLTFMVSSDCFDLTPATLENEDDDASVVTTAADVALFGLNFIIPLMTLDLLKYPSLCAQYYRLIVLIDDIYPEKICTLPEEMLGKLLGSVELGLTQFGSDIVQAALDFIHGLVMYIYRRSLQETACAKAVEKFLKLLLELTLTQQINSDMLDTASASVYVLMSCYQERYGQLVQELISVHMSSDRVVGERLQEAFEKLTVDVPLNCERQPKLKFRNNFKTFITSVHGFLLVK